MRRILLLIVALIVYGSLYPWNFHWYAPAANPLSLVFASWPVRITRFLIRDVAVNVVLYIPLGLFAFLAFARKHSHALRATAALLLAFLLSTGIEVLQLFDAGRYSSGFDVACNVLGAALGVVLAIVLHESVEQTLVRSELLARLRISAPLLLLLCWMAYELFPLLPDLSRTRLHHKVSALVSAGSFSLVEFLLWFACWLAAARLLESLAGARYALRALALLLLSVPAKLFIASRSFTWPELIAAIFALMVWKWLQDQPRRTIWTAGLLGFAFLIYGLSPFRPAHTPTEFSWVPFRASLAANWIAGLPILLRKSYAYGAVIWLLGEAGFPRALAATGVVLLLAMLEGMQIYLPPHVPEITDPLLAVLMAMVLALADLHHE